MSSFVLSHPPCCMHIFVPPIDARAELRLKFLEESDESRVGHVMTKLAHERFQQRTECGLAYLFDDLAAGRAASPTTNSNTSCSRAFAAMRNRPSSKHSSSLMSPASMCFLYGE